MAATDVSYVRVSAGSRQDARPASGEVETFLQEYQRLAEEKRDLEAKLSTLGKGAFLKEQQAIRREFPRDSLNRWIERKSELEKTRSDWVRKKQEIEKRMAFIKARAIQEKRAASDASDTGRSEIVSSLEAIRGVLVEILDILKHRQI